MKLTSFLAVATLALAAGSSYAQTKLTLGHGAAPGNPRHEAAVAFANAVKQKSGGKIEVQVAPSAQLGDDAAMITALRSGTLDMSANSQGAASVVVPEYAAFGMPFLFADPAAAFKLLDGPVGKELAEKSAAKNLVVLGYWDNGIRHVSNNKRPVLTPADMKGLKIRTPPDAVTIDIMTALGAETQQIKFAELYVALQQGVVDGQENPLANVDASKALRSAEVHFADGPQVRNDAAADEQAHLGSPDRGRAQDHHGSRQRSDGRAAQAFARSGRAPRCRTAEEGRARSTRSTSRSLPRPPSR